MEGHTTLIDLLPSNIMHMISYTLVQTKELFFFLLPQLYSPFIGFPPPPLSSPSFLKKKICHNQFHKQVSS